MFKVTNLSIYYNNNKEKHFLLQDICFSLNKGDCLGIIGKSGAGKSTLAKALLKIYENNVIEESGDIHLNGIPFDSSFRGKKICLLFQNPNSYLNPLMKVGKQISEMLTTHLKFNKKEAKLKSIEFMKKIGLTNAEKLYNYYPYELSGGMQQKVSLCIALVCNPDILILDECSSYLDNKSKKDILSTIKELQKENNFTIIMISHDLNEIYYLCNKIAIMNDGQMIEFGTKNEILSSPLHPHTIELLYDYLRFYENIDYDYYVPSTFTYIPNITMLSDTHYVRLPILQTKVKPSNFDEIKERIYERLENEKH